MATTTTAPANISNYENVTIGDKTFTKAYANDVANQEEMRLAVVNGNNQVSVSDKLGNTWDNATGNQTSFVPQPQAFQPNYSYIDEADKARQAMIQARLAEQLGAQDGMIRDAEGNLVKTTAQINESTYNNNEMAKASGTQRGIQYSQQQQGIQNGVERNGMNLKIDAGKERDKAIMNIKDRIAALKSGASYEAQASTAQANAEKGKAMNDAGIRQEDRNWQLEDIKNSQDYADKTTEKGWTHDDEVRYKGWAHEEAVADKLYNNQINIMGIDQSNKKELLGLEFKQKKEFLALETNVQKEILAIKNKYDVNMFGLSADLQVKIQGMSNATQMALGQLSANTQQSIASANRDSSDAQFKASIDLEKSKMTSQFASNYFMNDPDFQAYPVNNKEAQLTEKWMKSQGIDDTTIGQLLKGKKSFGSVVNSIAEQKRENISTTNASLKKFLLSK